MNLPEISIRHPVFAWMLMAALLIFGTISFKRLGISQLPDVDFPVVSVSLSLNGAAPVVMESQVIDPLEDAIMQIDGIRSLRSTAQQSSGTISVEFELNRNINEAMQQVQDRISQVKNLLPTNLYPPTVRKSNPEDQPILWIALTHDGSQSLIDTMIFARNYLYNQFSTVPGVGNVVLGGYVDPALRVWLNLDQMKNYSITADDVLNAIQAEHVEVPVGRIENSKSEFNVRIRGEARNPNEFGDIRVSNRSGLGANYKPLPLKEIATITEDTIDVRKISRYNGRPAVGLGILKQHGSNAVEVARLVRERLKEIQPNIPKQFKVVLRSDSTKFIRQSVDELNFNLVLSAILTSLVCYFFLGSWSSTINVLMAIPTSIIGTFIAIYFLGFTLNTFTLLGLSLAIGVVVDDAIMMLENIVRHREMGQRKKEAALKGSQEITFAAMAATLAVVAIFIPVVFMKGVIGRYFLQYGVTVAVAVLLSLLEALTLTPMRCSLYLSVQHDPAGFAGKIDSLFQKLAQNYQRILRILLNHRFKTVGIALVLFISSLGLAKLLPSELMPAQDQSQILLRFKAPVGSSLGFMNDRMKIAEEYLSQMPEVEGNYSVVGGFGGDAVNQGMIFITLVDPKKRSLTQANLIKKIRPALKEKLKDVEVIAQDLSLKGFASTRGFPVEFIVQGPDWDLLTQYTKQIMEHLKASGLATDVNTDVQAGMPEIKVVPDRKKLAAHGVSVGSVTSAVNALFGGAILNGQTQYAKSGHRYSIEARLLASQRDKKANLRSVQVRNNRGQGVPLSDLVTFEEKPSLMLISRLNRARAITVYANPTPGHSQQEALHGVQKIGKSLLPPGYFLKLTGSSQSFKESFQGLFFAILMGILTSYMVLASQFNSFLHPVTVLMALPFSISGAFVSLGICHQSINIYSMIGLILLMGIVKKNSILLVDFTNQCRSEGQDVRSALLRACPVRLRPIIMTSLATVAGALPEAIAIGPGAETTIPMAIAIIGGILASTVLTLFVVPCAYSLIANLERPDLA